MSFAAGIDGIEPKSGLLKLTASPLDNCMSTVSKAILTQHV